MHLLGGYDPGDARGDAQRQSCQRGVVHGGRVGRLAPLHARVAAVRLGRAAQHLPHPLPQRGKAGVAKAANGARQSHRVGQHVGRALPRVQPRHGDHAALGRVGLLGRWASGRVGGRATSLAGSLGTAAPLLTRETSGCSPATASAAATTGSRVRCGAAPWPPRPRMVASKRSEAAMMGPACARACVEGGRMEWRSACQAVPAWMRGSPGWPPPLWAGLGRRAAPARPSPPPPRPPPPCAARRPCPPLPAGIRGARAQAVGPPPLSAGGRL